MACHLCDWRLSESASRTKWHRIDVTDHINAYSMMDCMNLIKLMITVNDNMASMTHCDKMTSILRTVIKINISH